MNTVSVIIPAFNEEKYIERCISSVIKHTPANLLEILVIDNNSTDQTKEIAGKFKQVKVILEEKKGVMHARQRGFREAKGTLLAFLDSDNEIPEDWFKKIDNYFLDPKLVCLSGPYIFNDISLTKQKMIGVFWRTLAVPTYFIVGYMAMCGNMILRREILEKMKGFDTSIVFYGDDTDTSRRASKYGKVLFDPNFTVYSSARRLNQQGMISTSTKYFVNFFSQVFFNRSINKEYEEFR